MNRIGWARHESCKPGCEVVQPKRSLGLECEGPAIYSSYRMDWAVKQKEMNWPRVCWERGQSNRGVERAACDGPSSFQRDVLGCVDNKDVERTSSDSPSFSQRDGLGRVDNRPKSAGKEGQPSLIVSWASMPLKTILDDSVERASSDDPSSFQRDGLGRLDNRPTSAGREGQPTLAMSWAPLPLKTPLDEPVIKAMASIHHLHAEGWCAEENLVSGMVSTAVRGASESCSIADACLLEEVSRYSLFKPSSVCVWEGRPLLLFLSLGWWGL